jgi:Phage integrase, N-terminal SAM-like domain
VWVGRSSTSDPPSPAVVGEVISDSNRCSAERRQPTLLEQVRRAIRPRPYSMRTADASVPWITRGLLVPYTRHPNEMGGDAVRQFLSDLAVHRQGAASLRRVATAGRGLPA